MTFDPDAPTALTTGGSAPAGAWEARLSRLAAALLASSMVLTFAVMFLVVGGSTGALAFAAALLVLAVLYATLIHGLTTLGRHAAPRRLRTWAASLLVHALALGLAYAYWRSNLVLAVLLPELLSGLLHPVGLYCALKALRGKALP